MTKGERTWDVPHPRTEDISLDALIERLREDRDPCEEADLMHEAAQALTALRGDLETEMRAHLSLAASYHDADEEITSLKAEIERLLGLVHAYEGIDSPQCAALEGK